ncbi:MAG: putative metallopeptidase [Candidatus Pacearchaeota archaeon]|nr:putative metallopeptidase [Candidatus Pacearchaeota archaeon]
MRYENADDLKKRAEEIAKVLGMNHIDFSRVGFIRSYGSKTRGTIARCHALGKLMQKALGIKAFYAIEFLERFNKMSKEEQDKTIIHELMHIPKCFGGGFRHHDFVCEKEVNNLHRKLISKKEVKEVNENKNYFSG